MKSNLAKKLVQQHIQMLIKSIEGKLRYSITCKILTVYSLPLAPLKM